MKQKLLTDIELDVHGLKYLMDLYSKEPTQALGELLQRNILHMQECLDELLQDLDSVQDNSPISLIEEESEAFEAENSNVLLAEEFQALATEEPEVLVAEKLKTPIVEELQAPVNEEVSVLKQNVVEEETATEETATEETVEDTVEKAIVETVTEEAVTEESEPVELQEQEEQQKEQEEEVKPSVLGESIKMTAGLRHSISLNDSFRFSRELFGGDVELMNRVVEQMSVMSSYKTASAFLVSKTSAVEESEALNDLLELLKKYFNQSA